MNRPIRIALTAALAVIVSEVKAHAYLDPGTGSYILQLLIAGLLGAGFAVKTFWKNIVAFFAGLFSAGKKGGDEPK